jgi:hypothetical protein
MNNPTIKFRRYTSEDLPEILRIQKDNFVSNLLKDDRQDGFLSVEFSSQQFEAMNRQIPIIVADLGSQLGGYVCGISLSSGGQVPILAHIISLFPETPFRNQLLDQYRSFIYGPVCVEKQLRGQGVLEGLYAELLHQLTGKFDVGVLFISQDNPRSLHAHIHKLGMENVRDFEFNGNHFSLLAFAVPSHSES